MNSGTRFWLILAAGLVLVTVLAGGAGSDGPPLDPRSVNPDGARGVVETLERLGADVELDSAVPAADATAALLIVDRLSTEDAEAVESWIRSGGALVVADPASRFAPFRSGFAGDTITSGECDLGWLRGTTITGTGRTFESGNGQACFGSGAESYLRVERRGEGTIASLGGPRLLINENLAQADNAFVITSLLAPDPERARVAVLAPSLVDFGEQSLDALVAPRVRNAILMLLASFGLYAIFRMRRLGAVVREPQPVPIRGSELVLQAGVLSERAQDPGAAAATIRADFVRRWRRTLAVEDDQPAQLADRIVVHLARPGGDRGSDVPEPTALLDALTRPIATDSDLLAVVRTLDAADHPIPQSTSDSPDPRPDPRPDQREVSPSV